MRPRRIAITQVPPCRFCNGARPIGKRIVVRIHGSDVLVSYCGDPACLPAAEAHAETVYDASEVALAEPLL